MALQAARDRGKGPKIEAVQLLESKLNLPYIKHSEQGPCTWTPSCPGEFQKMTSTLLERCTSPFQQ